MRDIIVLMNLKIVAKHMKPIGFLSKGFFWLGVCAVVTSAVCEGGLQTEQTGISESVKAAQPGKLGTVQFPATCTAEAQLCFLRGVAALHSFWYPLALAEFRAATRIDPNCMMGYWGEAMAHNHPLWGDPQETEAARKTIKKISFPAELTARERAWLNAVKVLYGEGEKAVRDKAYALAMEKIYREYPDDVEAALFYALALMGTVRPGDPADVPTRLRAGEIASAVYQKKPHHPGAAHYVIHAYDDPEHAHLALNAARHYAEIVPAAPHALHMPAHIFLQLGMWPEAAAANEVSWAASEDWVKQQNLPISERAYHSLHWLMYVYLQQGRYHQAEELLKLMRESLSQFPQDNPRDMLFGTLTHAGMAAAFVVETERWDAPTHLLSPLGTGETRIQTDDAFSLMQAYGFVAQIPAIFARGLAAAENNSSSAQKSMAELRSVREKASSAKEFFVEELIRTARIQELEIEAMIATAKTNFGEAIRIMRKATALEEAMLSPQGPPAVIKPSHELFGEILVRAGRPKEAMEQFAISLQRYPNRARTLLGAARAAAKSGDTQRAASFYAQFEHQWQQADVQQPERHEARDYAKQPGAR